MIKLTKLNGVKFALNSDLIEIIDENPDTTIHLVNKNFYIVQESTDEVIELIKKFKCDGRIKLNGYAIAGGERVE